MPDAMFPVKVVRGVPVVITPEEVNVVNATELRAALLVSAAHGPGAFAVDMSQTRFCDTAGLHALVRAHKRASPSRPSPKRPASRTSPSTRGLVAGVACLRKRVQISWLPPFRQGCSWRNVRRGKRFFWVETPPG
jgi:hypothetical protein